MDLFTIGHSYPVNDVELGSSTNDEFFLYYALTYAGPVDEEFLLSADTTAGWLRRGIDLYRSHVKLALENLPERFERVMPPATYSGALRSGKPQVFRASLKLDFDWWSNAASWVGTISLCAAGVAATIGTGGIGAGAGAAACMPLASKVSSWGFEQIISNVDRVREIYCPGNITVSECSARFDFGLFVGGALIGSFQNPSSLVNGGLGLAQKYAQSIDDVFTAANYYDVEVIRDAQGYIRGIEFKTEDEFGNLGFEIGIARPVTPYLQCNSVEFDDDANPTSLNISVESSRLLYQIGTTAQSTPALIIGGEDFPMERVNAGQVPARYEAQIPVSELPGFTAGTQLSSLSAGNPTAWSETITVTGTSFETLRGVRKGCFCGVDAERLELIRKSPNVPSEANAEPGDGANIVDGTAAILEIPANAFGGQAVFTSLGVASYSQFASPEQPELRPLSSAINVDTDDYSFSKSATLHIAFNQAGDEATVDNTSIFRRGENGRWKRVDDATIDFSEGIGTATIDSSGFYAVLISEQEFEEPPDQKPPEEFLLQQNYPNPFARATTIAYDLPEARHVTLTVYDVLGRQVAVLVDEEQEAGHREVRFDASGLASGVYFYRLEAGDFTESRMMVVVR